MYAKITSFLEKFISKKNIYKYGFNYSPMYRRSTGRVFHVSDDLHTVKVKIKLSYKNKNYVGSLFGGSMTSATDPIYMIQLMQILGNNFVVWDKVMQIKFKKPVRETAYAIFTFTEDEITQLKKDVTANKEVDLIKKVNITNKEQNHVFAEVSKTIYVADKSYYKEKKRK